MGDSILKPVADRLVWIWRRFGEQDRPAKELRAWDLATPAPLTEGEAGELAQRLGEHAVTCHVRTIRDPMPAGAFSAAAYARWMQLRKDQEHGGTDAGNFDI